MKMKKALAILLASAMALSLAACSGGSGSSGESSESSSGEGGDLPGGSRRPCKAGHPHGQERTGPGGGPGSAGPV